MGPLPQIDASLNSRHMRRLLLSYFENRKDVAFAFLFGSQAAGNATRRSDTDIAVYFYPVIRHPIEYEAITYYPAADEVWADLERLMGSEVDLVVLNRASAPVSASALRGKPIIIKDWGLYFDFMITITDEADALMDAVIGAYDERRLLEQRSSL